MRKYRIEVAVISEETTWDKIGEVRDRLEQAFKDVKGVKEGLSSSISPFD